MSESSSTRISHQDVRASLWFLQESEVYATVKPYNLAFTPEIQIPQGNIERREVSVLISDLHGSEQLFSLNRNGFRVLEFQGPYNDVGQQNERERSALPGDCVRDRTRLP